MKKVILSLTLLLSLETTFAKTLVISDIDDTIKVTNVLSKTMVIFNGLFSRKSFSGMSELYQELNIADTSIFYVSGSPTYIRGIVENFLEYNNFPQKNNLILKDGSIPTYDYKLKEIRALILKNKPDKIILLGDDTEVDPEVYDTIFQENQTSVEGIYIRAIRNRKLPNNTLIKNFFSSVEVAALELLKGNVNVNGLNKVASSFLAQKDISKIVIPNRYCPSEGRAQIEELIQQVVDQSSIDSLERTQQKIIATCKG
jgi:phosphatidate phosphatase APP1